MQRPTSFPRAIFTLCVVLAIALVAEWTARAEAGDRTEPSLAPRQQAAETFPPLPRPVYLYTGSCDDLDAIQWPLNTLVSPYGEFGGSDDVDRTEYSFTANVPLTIDLMLSGRYAINVHESGENLENVISCGNLGGVADAVGTLVIGLREKGGSDVTGIAVLSPNPADSAMTYVSVFIAGSSLGDDIGTIGIAPPLDDSPPSFDGGNDGGAGDDDDGGGSDDDGGGD